MDNPYVGNNLFVGQLVPKALPSSFMAALYERRPSVVISAGEPWRFSAFFMKRRAIQWRPIGEPPDQHLPFPTARLHKQDL
jgi:hypothetical protein